MATARSVSPGKLGVRPKNILAFTRCGASFTKRKRDAVVSYTDSQAATTTFTVKSPRKGYRSGRQFRIVR